MVTAGVGVKRTRAMVPSGLSLDNLIVRALPASSDSGLVAEQRVVELEHDVLGESHAGVRFVNELQRVSIAGDLLLRTCSAAPCSKYSRFSAANYLDSHPVSERVDFRRTETHGSAVPSLPARHLLIEDSR